MDRRAITNGFAGDEDPGALFDEALEIAALDDALAEAEWTDGEFEADLRASAAKRPRQ